MNVALDNHVCINYHNYMLLCVLKMACILKYGVRGGIIHIYFVIIIQRLTSNSWMTSFV